MNVELLGRPAGVPPPRWSEVHRPHCRKPAWPGDGGRGQVVTIGFPVKMNNIIIILYFFLGTSRTWFSTASGPLTTPKSTPSIQPWGENVKWFIFGFFWVHFCCFFDRSIVVTNYEETIKMPINEPAQGLRWGVNNRICQRQVAPV